MKYNVQVVFEKKEEKMKKNEEIMKK